jgi:hypothetical protein
MDAGQYRQGRRRMPLIVEGNLWEPDLPLKSVEYPRDGQGPVRLTQFVDEGVLRQPARAELVRFSHDPLAMRLQHFNRRAV